MQEPAPAGRRSVSFGVRFAVSALLAALLGAPVRGQQPERTITVEEHGLLLPPGGSLDRDRLAAWLNCVYGPGPGWSAEACHPIVAWRRDELSAVVAAVRKGKIPVAAAEIPAVLRRAAFLYTESGLDEVRAFAQSDVAVTGVTGLQLRMAGQLVEELRRRSPGDPFVRAWFLTSGALLLSQREVSVTAELLDRALDLFPADPQLLLFAGTAREWRASFRVQDADDLQRVRARIGGKDENLARAEAFYRKAIACDRSLVEARVRLGRVLGLRGSHVEAVAELDSANSAAFADASSARQVRFWASLFLGDEQAALGRYDLSRASYRRALTLYPAADSAHLALTRLEHLAGARDAALAVVVDMVNRRGAVPEDPWRDYYRPGEARNIDALLQNL